MMRLLSCMVLCSVALVAQAREQREAVIGMRAVLEGQVVSGTELVPAPAANDAAILVTILKVWPHGEQLRYDFEWVGYEPGRFDLKDYLARKDGSSMDAVPSIKVDVKSLLPSDVMEPSDLGPAESQRLDGYSTEQVAASIVWGVGLLAILFLGRKRKPKPLPAPPPPTLADRLRPLVEEVAGGKADNSKKAELERLLVAYWRSKLNLGSERAAEAIMAIRKHDEAGALLRQVEAWLHAPEPPASMDIAALLRPYRSVTADSFAPIVGATGSQGGTA